MNLRKIPFRGRRAQRTWLIAASVIALVLALALPGLANLPGSSFEGGDGNLVVNTPGNTDWANVPGRAGGIDLPSGRSDNSFGQGTKEDGADVTVVTGSIPPNKSDLTRFYEASETIGTDSYLYLAWERSNVLGSANMDFEINQATTPNLGDPGPHSINRTAGDLLVTYDFANGGSNPILGLNTWLTNSSQGSCFKAQSPPCWGNHLDLNSANSEGAINTVTVTDPIPPDAPRQLPALTFGEAAINLTGAGVFPPGTCKAFGSVFLKSRSSTSFTAEVKDFVAPVPVNISNCGAVVIRKVTDPSPDPTDSSFSYSTTGGLNPSSFTLKNGGARDYGSNVPQGSYSVTEADPSGLNFQFVSLDCSASDTSHGTTITVNGRTVSFDLKADDKVDCTYTNKLLQGALKITKTAKNHNLGSGDHPQSGVSFTITGPGGYSNTQLTDSNGQICVDNLTFGTYTATETVPTGYSADGPNPQNANVSVSATCGSGNEASLSFHNTPLSQIRVTFHSKAGAGVTAATIQCTGEGSPSNLPDDNTGHLLDDLAPGTYDCQVVVDP